MNVLAFTPYPIIVRYWPFTDCCSRPSDAEPYSPEIAEFVPLFVCASVIEPAAVAMVPPALSENCCSTIGAAVSRAAALERLVLFETVLMTRSPEVSCAWADMAQNVARIDADNALRTYRRRRGFLIKFSMLPCFAAVHPDDPEWLSPSDET